MTMACSLFEYYSTWHSMCMTFTNNYCEASISPASSKYLSCKRKNNQRARFHIAFILLFALTFSKKKKKKRKKESPHSM